MQRVCMAIILLAACWFDIRCSKIPNRLILVGWTISLVLAAWRRGIEGLLCSIAGILVVIAAGFPLYWCRAIGAGDVKLLSVLAGIDGLRRPVQVFAVGILLAAVAGMFIQAGSAFGLGRWMPTCWERYWCGRKEVNGEVEKRRPGRHRIILAPFLALAYFFLWFWDKE